MSTASTCIPFHVSILCRECIGCFDIYSIECIRDPCPVSTVSTYIVLMVWLKSPQCQLSKTFLQMENRLNIKVRGNFIQSRVEFSHLIVLCIRCCIRATNTSLSTVSTNIAFNALHTLIFISTVSTNKIPYTIHNSIALILCINHLDMPFNVHTTDKVTVSSFLTI